MARVWVSVLTLLIFSTFASAQDMYKIRTGDVLRVEVLEDSSLNRDALVLPDGTVTLPLIGSVSAKGKTIGAVQSAVIDGLAPNFAAKPTVFVSIATLSAPAAGVSASRSKISVYVMGEVARPGKADIAAGTSILQFLAESGGFTKFAATKRIQVRRADRKTGKEMVFGFNYKAVESGAASVSSIILQAGDVIVVPERRLFE